MFDLHRCRVVIRLFVLAAASMAAAPSSAQDVIIHRDGTRDTGRLKACVADRCQLDERSVPRADIEWIGLSGAGGTWTTAPGPPATSFDRITDMLFLRDGTSEEARLVGISEADVVTERRSLPRLSVAWIHLSEPWEATPSPVISAEPTPAVETPTSVQPTPGPTGPSVQPTPSSQARSRPATPVSACPADQPLGGWIRMTSDYVHTRAQPCEGSQTLSIRFNLEAVPQTGAPNAIVAGVYRAKELTYDISYDGCRDVPGDRDVCTAAARQLQGTAPLTEENLGYVMFFPTQPQVGFQLPREVVATMPLPMHCQYPDGGGFDTTVDIGAVGLTILDQPHCDPVGFCFHFCTPPTECMVTEDWQIQSDCLMRAERYAVIPFEGSATNRYDETASGCSGPMTNEVSWKVCCGCGAGSGR